MKKLCLSVLSAVLAVSCVQAPIQAKANTTKEEIKVSVQNDSVTIGNEYIEREISTKDNKVSTTSITNKRPSNDIVFTPEKGSEEFKIRVTKKAAGELESKPIELEAIDRKGWVAEADSYQSDDKKGDGPASNLIDGDPNTIWHSKYNDSGKKGDTSLPHNVVFKLKKEEKFQSFSYTPRQNGVETNGNIKKYNFYISNKESDQPLSPEDNYVTLGDFG